MSEQSEITPDQIEKQGEMASGTRTEKIICQFVKTLIDNGQNIVLDQEAGIAAGVSMVAICNSLQRAFAKWQTDMLNTILMSNDNEAPDDSWPTFMAFAERYRDELGIPPEVDFKERIIHGCVIDDRPARKF